MIGIISDIHGNHVALVAVLEALDRLGVNKIICLGDVAGYYSQINECCNTLRRRNIISLMGNHDWYLVTGEPCGRSQSANRCLEYQRRIIDDANVRWLASLNSSTWFDGKHCVHGGWVDPLDEYVQPSTEYFAKLPGECFASGHTHVPCVWSNGGTTYVNPGSVGQPRDGDARAAFATWDHRRVVLHRVEYDFSKTQQQMRDAGFDDYFSENLSRGTRIGGKIDAMKSQCREVS